jgi:murein DD-endopeptidase MepM/ murein hydrolase activator NlpD
MFSHSTKQSTTKTIKVGRVIRDIVSNKEKLFSAPITNSINMVIPSSFITSKYGMRRHPMSRLYTFHKGIDLAAPLGTDIYPVAKGVIIEIGKKEGYGNFVSIDHGRGIKTFYAHLLKPLIVEGDTVDIDTKIAKVGMTGRTTGPHLHLEMSIVGEQIDPQKAEKLFRKIME